MILINIQHFLNLLMNSLKIQSMVNLCAYSVHRLPNKEQNFMHINMK